MRIKTWTPNADQIERKWWVIDAKDQTLGRLASQVAYLLRGKHKPEFATHADVGDFVVIINAERIHVTGRRLDQKVYHHHSGYPGGLKAIPMRHQLETHPERIMESAIKGMLPKNSLGRKMFGKLKIYTGTDHPHAAQKPQVWEGRVK
jgi:large subunit ribosomal protein L13